MKTKTNFKRTKINSPRELVYIAHKGSQLNDLAFTSLGLFLVIPLLILIIGNTIRFDIKIVEAKEELLQEEVVELKPVIELEEEIIVEVIPSQYQDNQYEYIDKAVEILTTFEGFATTAYCDNLIYTSDGRYVKHCPTGNERFSIGYGTTSYKGETITYTQGVSRMRADIAVRGEELKDLTCYNNNEKAAILDFYYNSGKYTKHNVTGIYFVYYVKQCNKEAIRGFLDPTKYQSKGLKKRRGAQEESFNKKED